MIFPPSTDSGMFCSGGSFSARLGEISGQLQEFIHKIAESRKCSLQSLELELHLGDLKVSVHDCEDAVKQTGYGCLRNLEGYSRQLLW